MPKISSALLVLVLSCGLASSADARKWRGSHSYQHEHSSRSDGNKGRRTLTPEDATVGALVSGEGAFGAVVDQLVRGCAERGAELATWPFDDIARIAELDELQRSALEALRGAAKEVAGRLALDCPQEVPAAPSARLEAVEQGTDVTLSAFAMLQPALQAFYGALDDEQKARLLRDMTMSTAWAQSSERQRRSRGRASARARADRELGA